MAHFAELDENNIVKRVVVVANDIETAAGSLGDNDMHVDGETWCAKFFKGGVWKQTSYTHNFRKQFCGLNFTYDSVQDIFIQPQPYLSFTLNSNNDWQPPVVYPTIITYEDPLGEVYVEPQPVYSDPEEPTRITGWNPFTIPEGKSVGDVIIKLYNIKWDEPNLKWIAKDKENPENNFSWDASALSWVSE